MTPTATIAAAVTTVGITASETRSGIRVIGEISRHPSTARELACCGNEQLPQQIDHPPEATTKI